MLWISCLGLLSVCPTDFGLLCPHFHLFQSIFWFLSWSHCWLIPWLVLFSFHVFVYFSVLILLLIFSFVALWSQKMLDMISVFWNLLRLVFCPNMCFLLENTPWVLEKNVYFAAVGWNALKISMKSIWSSVLFKAAVSLLNFCLEDQSIEVNRILKSLTMTVFLLIYPFMSIKICFSYLGAPILVT